MQSADPEKTDFGDFAEVNRVYAGFFTTPYPARACYEVKALPNGAKVKIEAVIAVDRSARSK
ncbi:Rid family hydrolase [Ensifer sp. BR816]|uniref:Rid family hydrolase n=1 Tax=Rhizobium sp. (strain BR816) TaxID=1057002 RepID=UPI000377D816